MSEYGDMYREFAKGADQRAIELRKEADAEELRAESYRSKAKLHDAAHERLKNTDVTILVAAEQYYDANPKMTTRSDDSYSMWQEPMRWHELSDMQKLEYVTRVERLVKQREAMNDRGRVR